MLGEGRPSFSRKRSKKLLFALSRTLRQARAKQAKVFWFFSSEKNGLLTPP
jgi:hypothetical protein